MGSFWSLPRPAFAAGMLLVLGVFFFLAATNTLAGWLYVLSAALAGVLVAGWWLPARMLAGLSCTRLPVGPVHVGEPLPLLFELKEGRGCERELLVLEEERPAALGGRAVCPIERLGGGETYRWQSAPLAERRGRVVWSGCRVRTAAPLGLFWRTLSFDLPQQVLIYPRRWHLRRAPLLDCGLDRSGASATRSVRPLAEEGLVRSVRAYRSGDSLRTIHWRSSARRGQWLVRELEHAPPAATTAVLALDGSAPWSEAAFEQALEAVTSLFCYALDCGRPAAIWTGEVLLSDRARALAYLAELESASLPRPTPISGAIWLSCGGGAWSAEAGRRVVLDGQLPLAAQLEVLG